MQWEALDIPDPETPVGARGIGEPPVGAGCCAMLNALSDALGDEVFRRAPVALDTILTSLEAGKPMQEGVDRAHLEPEDIEQLQAILIEYIAIAEIAQSPQSCGFTDARLSELCVERRDQFCNPGLAIAAPRFARSNRQT